MARPKMARPKMARPKMARPRMAGMGSPNTGGPKFAGLQSRVRAARSPASWCVASGTGATCPCRRSPGWRPRGRRRSARAPTAGNWCPPPGREQSHNRTIAQSHNRAIAQSRNHAIN
eukprot:4406184-Prymnesium_polylepis.1